MDGHSKAIVGDSISWLSCKQKVRSQHYVSMDFVTGLTELCLSLSRLQRMQSRVAEPIKGYLINRVVRLACSQIMVTMGIVKMHRHFHPFAQLEEEASS